MPYVVVAYDVSDDGRRTRVARVLKNILDRVQKSVFEGEVDLEQLDRVESRSRQLIEEKTDSLRIYLLCLDCRRRIRAHGPGHVWEDPDVFIV